jgi:hypothetical protein
MKLKLRLFGIMAALATVMFGCAEAVLEEEAPKYDDAGRRLVDFTIPTGNYDNGGGGIRALSPDIAKASWDYIQVVFALDEGGNGNFDLSMFFGAAASKGEDLHFSIPEGKYKGIMFAGTVKGFKLLAVGTVSALINESGYRGSQDDVNGTILGSDGHKYVSLEGNINNSERKSEVNNGEELKGYFELGNSVRTIEFTLTSFTSNIQDKSVIFKTRYLNPVLSSDGDHTLIGLEYMTDIREGQSGFTDIDNRDVPYFFLPSDWDYPEFYDPDDEHSGYASFLADGGITKKTVTYLNGNVDSESEGITLNAGDVFRGITGKWTVKGFGELPVVGDLLDEEGAAEAGALFGLTTMMPESFVSSTGISGYNPLTKVVQEPVPVKGRTTKLELNAAGDLVVDFDLQTSFDGGGLEEGMSKLRFDLPVQAFINYEGKGVDSFSRGYTWHIVNGLESSVIDMGYNDIGQEILLNIGQIANANDITVPNH